MPKEQRTVPKEFNVEAVHVVHPSEKSQSHVARDLGSAESTRQHGCADIQESLFGSILNSFSLNITNLSRGIIFRRSHTRAHI